MKDSKPRKRLPVQDYISGVLNGDRVILSRAITVIESSLESDKQLSKKIVQGILPYSGNSIRVLFPEPGAPLTAIRIEFPV